MGEKPTVTSSRYRKLMIWIESFLACEDWLAIRSRSCLKSPHVFLGASPLGDLILEKEGKTF